MMIGRNWTAANTAAGTATVFTSNSTSGARPFPVIRAT